MNNLNLTFNGTLRPYTEIYIDNNRINLKKIKNGQYGLQYQTEKSNIELTMKSYSRLHTRFWLLIELVYFIISIFGIFDERFGKYCYETHCKINLSVSSNTNATLNLITPINNGKVVKCESDNTIQEIENSFVIDNIAKKRNKILKISKIMTVIAVAILIFVLI